MSLVYWDAMLNVRRLMYQPLIRAGGMSHHASGLRPPVDSKSVQRPANALVHGVRGNAEFLGDFLG
jgi:hypothetical protein